MHRYTILILVVFGFLYSENIAKLKKDIFLWEHQRQGLVNLHKLSQHKNKQIRQLSVQALGRIQKPESIEYIAKCLTDKEVEVRVHAAFALGQMWITQSEAHLLKALESEEDSQVTKVIIEALGKVGGEKTIQKFLQKISNPVYSEDITYASGLIVYRGMHNEALIRRLVVYTMHPSKKIRGHVSYSLMRAKKPRTINHLVQLLYDKNAYCRMNAARGLGYIKHNKAITHLYVAIHDKDSRVAVNAINALGNFSNIDIAKISPLIKSKNHHISLAAIRVIGNLKLKVHKKLLDIFSKSNDLQKGEILVALAKIDAKICLQKISLLEKTSVLLQVKIAEALGFIDNPQSVKILQKMLSTTNNQVIQTVVASLGKISCIDTTSDLVKALQTLDMAIVTYAAEALANKNVVTAIPELENTYSKLRTPNDIEAMQAIINAIGKLTNKTQKAGIAFLQKTASSSQLILAAIAKGYLKQLGILTTKEQPSSNITSQSFPYEEIQNLPNFKIEVLTSKGTFTIRPCIKEAPIAVYNFYQLIQKKFYNNLTFHRVVSNFVVQGGDPRGDGWGGPGYNIPCEYNMLRYHRGMVGMPLAGKDTGGCQLFITHSPQPHLNGKYTIFGEVISGMEIVDLIQTGDMIKNVNIVLVKPEKKLQKENKK
ncbi:HEAT repeat domain-containing protein [Candidatus Uabimicrobium sp. HlEnr_7]|uniref:HEAT repeat domain-containing protein n=1 Tax=Candidatus Uabimicrobium helgolandensis TaxID=3095367 RepID=UPI003557AB8C